jgi:hypothetical protein
MKDIEKNDVSISKLFKWGAKMVLPTPQGNVDIWMKIIGDADIGRARVYALRKSSDMRKRLKDLDSDDRIAMIPDLDLSTKDKVIELLLTLLIRDITNIAIENTEIKYPKELLSTASVEEQEEYQKIVDGFPAYVEALNKVQIDKGVEKERKRLYKLSDKDLEELYVNSMINRICENEMYQCFQDKTVFFACFTDDTYKTHLFESFEDYQDLPTEISTLLSDFYSTLSIDIDYLKKSQEVAL